MQICVLIAAAALLLVSPVAAGEPASPKAAKPAAPAKVLPLKGAASGNACAAFGPGFVKVEGTDTCVHIGGSISVGAGGSVGAR